MVATNLKLAQASRADESAEQRVAPRFTMMLRQARLISARGQYLCIVRDISETAIRVKLFHPLPDCKRMELEIVEARRVRMEKVWSDGEEAGFRFAAPLDLPRFLAEQSHYPRRQFRIDLDLPVMVHSGALATEARTINVSQQGACISCPAPLARRQLVRLESGALPPVHATVLWRSGETYGLVFEELYSFPDFAAALGRLRGLGGGFAPAGVPGGQRPAAINPAVR